MADWTTLDELPAGTLFETENGARGFKSPDGIHGLHFFKPVDASIVRVRPLDVERLPAFHSILNRPCTLAVTSGSSRFGAIVDQDERGVWFRGKMERDNPKERERTYFVPWGSVVWLEMEGE